MEPPFEGLHSCILNKSANSRHVGRHGGMPPDPLVGALRVLYYASPNIAIQRTLEPAVLPTLVPSLGSKSKVSWLSKIMWHSQKLDAIALEPCSYYGLLLSQVASEAISERLKFSWGSMPPDTPGILMHVYIHI